MPVLVSVIIPVHNAASTLAEQLDALAAQVDAPAFEVILAFNRCTDGSRQLADGYAGRLNLVMVDADGRASAAHARNCGARAASSDILLFCDADDRVAPDWVRRMAEPLSAATADLVGSKVIVDRRELPKGIYRARYASLDERVLQENSCILYPISASMGCRRPVFEAVDGFDEEFPAAGAEEVDFAFRVQRQGARVAEVPSTSISYRPRRSIREVATQMRNYAVGGAALAAKEGRPSMPMSRRRLVVRVARTLAQSIIRRRVFDPVELLLRARWVVEVNRAAKQCTRLAPSSTPELLDFTVPTSTPIIGGLSLVATASTQRWYHVRGIEQRSLAVVRALLEPDDVFVDVGANIGEFSIAAALTGARVIAFEPGDRAMQGLRVNAKRHRVQHLVDARQEGASSEVGTATFINVSNDVLSSFTTAPPEYSPGSVVGHQVIPITTLDAAVAGRVDMVKIDVEGHETAVIDGAGEALARNPGLLLMVEVNPTSLRHSGSSIDELLARLGSDRWSLLLIDDRVQPHYRWVDDDVMEFMRSAPEKWYGNLLAVPVQRHEEIRNRLAALVG